MENAPRKITVPEGGMMEKPLTVTNSQIDVYHHMNNAIYIQLAQEYLPEDFDIFEMRAEYSQAAVPGDVMHPRLIDQKNIFYVIFETENNGHYATIEFKRRKEC